MRIRRRPARLARGGLLPRPDGMHGEQGPRMDAGGQHVRPCAACCTSRSAPGEPSRPRRPHARPPAHPPHANPLPQTVDNWWSDSSSCLIPGDAFPVFPYNYKAVDVCGGETAISTHPLTDANGTVYGAVYFFRNFFNRLLITVALDGSPDGQWFLQVPSNGAPASH